MKTMFGMSLSRFFALGLVTMMVMGFSYKKESKGTVLTGIASYYSDYYEGRITSNGEVFRQNQLTAASKDLKFGTMVKLTNLKNDSVVIVRINDRMPQYNKRLIDLSYRAAKQLNFIREGLANVKLEILESSVVKN
jgi:rare lipoprotein A